MSIHELLKYNQSMGKWDGYVNFGEGIAVPDPDVLAKDALVFLLVSFKGGWKYPVGYVLCDKISGKDLNTLLKKSLDFCVEANLKVRCVTMDGTSTNFSAMKLFGCKTGTSLREIFPFFVHEGYDHLMYFIPDPPHMLKLARNALAELKVFIDGDGNKIEWKYIERLHEIQNVVGIQ